ncbi:hypothetical protein BSZ22_28710 [Bradyrhizobium canariense]|uniref:Uncharacterized protein n=1 Tax=Bradyrhizobium canariense TaxID=255045 RepID=A0A1X3GF19_9BRAD|nr:hypothetical protein BSZ22_28710 [Bradyrhizobium canariense]OSI76186.1 hypothetical protein BSZ23_25245 [Bradyrhizobium canariense]OSI87703.1 hypothetical protein BSZ24_25845 [Bradyrhizobium canariense]OSI99689.1 hypothetical protein BSZ16_26700 [Bradyrhizobium canariense]OSJ04103.1 hypothetical protein BSZ18_29035 [Bradyrhizobium canariense]
MCRKSNRVEAAERQDGCTCDRVERWTWLGSLARQQLAPQLKLQDVEKEGAFWGYLSKKILEPSGSVQPQVGVANKFNGRDREMDVGFDRASV